ncbi:MAG: CDP-diacylglycerol--glycerol-3-phosphate 3-phosphatidyltransferase, partial [Desulfobacterales bacterium]|nr:CDP-diacylglycerol--glycerol-3-phosphate 3-phosphatidyltransferase [Desulfobacterales bacterium]
MANLQNLIRGPNLLTLFRIAAVPIIIILLLFPNRLSVFMAAMVFSAAAITDYLDGFYARKRNMVTTLGKVMDPVADKLLVSSAFIMLAALDWVPAWMACIIIGRELAVTGLRNIIAEKGEDLSASNLGKFKTGFQIAAIIPLMIHFPFFGLNV